MPVHPGQTYLDWGLPDPKDLASEQVRGIRDDIENRVKELVAKLDAQTHS
jgi:arsenate reductase (thioredoxin)